MDTDFIIATRREGKAVYLSCAGELDIATAPKLADALDLSIDGHTEVMRVDGCGITLLTAAGVRVLYRLVDRCRSDGIELDLLLSSHCRRILDRVGLWWLGVLEDGPAADRELEMALKMFAELPHKERSGEEGSLST